MEKPIAYFDCCPHRNGQSKNNDWFQAAKEVQRNYDIIRQLLEPLPQNPQRGKRTLPGQKHQLVYHVVKKDTCLETVTRSISWHVHTALNQDMWKPFVSERRSTKPTTSAFYHILIHSVNIRPQIQGQTTTSSRLWSYLSYRERRYTLRQVWPLLQPEESSHCTRWRIQDQWDCNSKRNGSLQNHGFWRYITHIGTQERPTSTKLPSKPAISECGHSARSTCLIRKQEELSDLQRHYIQHCTDGQLYYLRTGTGTQSSTYLTHTYGLAYHTWTQQLRWLAGGLRRRNEHHSSTPTYQLYYM